MIIKNIKNLYVVKKELKDNGNIFVVFSFKHNNDHYAFEIYYNMRGSFEKKDGSIFYVYFMDIKTFNKIENFYCDGIEEDLLNTDSELYNKIMKCFNYADANRYFLTHKKDRDYKIKKIF